MTTGLELTRAPPLAVFLSERSTSEAPMFLKNYWYVAAVHARDRPQAVPPHHHERTRGDVPHRGRHAGRAGRPLPAPPPAAVDGQARQRRRAAMPLSRAALRPHRRLRARAGPGHDPGDRAGQKLSAGRALQVAVDLDGRSGAGRSREDPGLSLVRRSELGREAGLSPRPVQLAATSTTICSISRISLSCTRPPSATWRWSSTPRCACSARRTACR